MNGDRRIEDRGEQTKERLVCSCPALTNKTRIFLRKEARELAKAAETDIRDLDNIIEE